MREGCIEGRMTRPRISGAVFRADHPAHTDLSRTSEASRAEPGRFNTSRFGAVYLSREPETALREAAFDSGAEAIMWPSATGRGVSLAVFLDRLTSGSSLDVIHTFELTPTVLNSVEAGVPIVTIHPLLATFAPIAQGAADERHPEDRG